jgi:transcriptional regulator with XRE-family HTH domain
MSDRPSARAEGRELNKALGLAVRTLRVGAGLSQVELGSRAELHPSSISKIENGRADPSWGNLRRIAKGLGVPLDELAELAERLERET